MTDEESSEESGEENDVSITICELFRIFVLGLWYMGVVCTYYLLKAYIYDDEDIFYEGLGQRLESD